MFSFDELYMEETRKKSEGHDGDILGRSISSRTTSREIVPEFDMM
jgi:hypothetical protein